MIFIVISRMFSSFLSLIILSGSPRPTSGPLILSGDNNSSCVSIDCVSINSKFIIELFPQLFEPSKTVIGFIESSRLPKPL
ncbi:hypothetical protein D3C76_1369030 [compost metagenome]